ncbi:mitogen-activated protein kinase HOG1-like [Asterias rubens]|uniref:mitogen-activated protein kinase HOG1-like n=1 Tax=Asterias rubens TaxID=7604 RepID=UPI0014550608|nr:mitogen-activated protein kinase HOG1-like [Asterias rubens]
MAKKQQYLDLNQSFYVGSRFCDLQPLGFGGGGQVYSAVDVEGDKCVAIKKVILADQKNCKVALREVRILRKLQHENIVKIHDVLSPPDSDHDNVTKAPAVYIVEELLDTDLRHIIDGGTLTKEHTRLFMYQLLRGIKYLHSANVLHRDLKPSNLLINLEDLVLKIGDFGMARILDPDYSHKGHLTQNVSTRWYRSPELIFCPSDYTKAIDMWSAGCIFTEMLTGKPIFPGDHDLEQMLLILEVIPVQEADLVEVEDSIPRKMLKNYKGSPRIALADVLPDIDPDAFDLLQSMLTFNPIDRASAEEAIQHPYLNIYSCASDEPQELDPFHVEYEVDNLSPVTLRKMIFSETQFVMEVEDQPCLNSLELAATNDFKDDYNWKMEMLSFSSRDNSDLESGEDIEEKVVLDKTSLKAPPKHLLPAKEENNEKNENEASEKSDEDCKEHKLLLWEQDMAARSSMKDVQEKGATESDGESSEKSESEDTKSEKEVEEDDLSAQKEQVLGSVRDSSEKNIQGPSPKFDKITISKKMEQPVPEADLINNPSEKAIDDKLQKEKQEEIPADEGTLEVQLLSVRRKERENKDLPDVHAPQLANNKVLYDEEKTLQKCLEKSCQLVDAKESPKNIMFSSNNHGLKLQEKCIVDNLPPQVASSSNARELLSMTQRSHTTPDSVLPRPTGFDEVLFVEIPRNPGILSGSPHSPQRPDGDKPTSVHSPRSRGSNSPREKSVRPKKQDWFYMHKGSNH